MSALCMNLCGPVENHDCHVVYCKRLTVTRLDSFNTMMLLVKPCIRLALQEKRPGQEYLEKRNLDTHCRQRCCHSVFLFAE